MAANIYEAVYFVWVWTQGRRHPGLQVAWVAGICLHLFRLISYIALATELIVATFAVVSLKFVGCMVKMGYIGHFQHFC